MKVIIQIPCYNEQEALPLTLACLPRRLPGVERVEWLVIDDGSRDSTADVARRCGADHVVRLSSHQGLARAFRAGLDEALRRGADVIVNTDADNQYHAGDIPRLVAPILDGSADMVVGARPIWRIPHFSPMKKILQVTGSWFVRRLSGTSVPDARSGFRALSADTAARLEIFSRYTYTLETLIQAGHQGMRVTSVPVRTNRDLRPSRLIRDVPTDLWRSACTMAAAYWRYRGGARELSVPAPLMPVREATGTAL